MTEAKIIEAGWEALRSAWLPPGTPADQEADIRTAFFAGAAYTLYEIIATTGDGGAEPTEDDVARIITIGQELQEATASAGVPWQVLSTDGSA